jgi:glycogen(starch) synthase
LPNGINTDKYPTIEERALLHNETKVKIQRFLESYFLPYYPVNVKDSLLLFTSGRYEFHTKGYDTFIHSLGWLNKLLKEEGYPKNIFVFFFIFDRGLRKYNYDVLENLSRYEHIEKFVDESLPEVEKKTISMMVHGNKLEDENLFDKEFEVEARRLMSKFKRQTHRRPPLCALKMGSNDPIYNTLVHEGLLNREEDKIKVVVYPTRITVGDGLLSMPYYDVMAGMHLGVFPSYYEPWGYTPLEAAAYSVMSITTDLAGFGKFVQDNSDQRRKPGILVLKRDGKSHEEAVVELKNALYWFSKLDRAKRVKKKAEAKEISTLADWKEFAAHYIEAENMAFDKCKKRLKKSG